MQPVVETQNDAAQKDCPTATASVAAADNLEPQQAPVSTVNADPGPEHSHADRTTNGQYGAATASLQNPACKPGTPEFNEAKAMNQALLQQYHVLKKRYEAQKIAKPDMKAAYELMRLGEEPVSPHQLHEAPPYGHIPGVAVGDQFSGRGELAVLRLHTNMMRGICSRKDMTPGAVAITLSGGYVDNDDSGETFTYAGAGGQDKGKKQIKDQTYEHADNAALLNNHKSKTPVRVFRGQPGQPPMYVYEGLYQVISHAKEVSSDGPLVIRFKMQGVPGHSAVNAKVEYKTLQRARAFQKIALAGATGKAKPQQTQRKQVPKNYKWSFNIPNARDVIKLNKERQAQGAFGRLVAMDISNGLEKTPIAAWNHLDDDDAPFVPSNLDALPIDADEDLEFDYITDYEFQSADDAKMLAMQAHELFKQSCPTECGIEFHNGACPYNQEKLLMSTEVYGLMECKKNCPGGKGKQAKLCKLNRVVQQGIRYPLEVFKVQGKGWGVRCASDVPIGAVLCPYIGVVMTDESAEQQHGADTYLYDINHFHLLEANQSTLDDPYRNPRLPLVPEQFKEHHLVVDASHEGNVTRFINHSCDPNCTTQTVFCKMARSHILHYIVIVAVEDIPKYTEVTYDYGSLYISDADGQEVPPAEGAAAAPGAGPGQRRIPCNCGAANCKGWLKG